jgi:DNA-binding NtrC family response regulator
MVQQNHFRKDLFYRLKAVSFRIPPLKERREDIPLLINHFVEETVSKNDIEFAGFTDEANDLIINYSWPGNIRELKNFVESVAILSKGNPVSAIMTRDHLEHYEEPMETNSALPMPTTRTVEQAERGLIYKALLSLGVELSEMKTMLIKISDQINGNYQRNMYVSPAETIQDYDVRPMDEIEREMIEKALLKFHGNRRKASRALNMSERTLYRKIKEYDLDQ